MSEVTHGQDPSFLTFRAFILIYLLILPLFHPLFCLRPHYYFSLHFLPNKFPHSFFDFPHFALFHLLCSAPFTDYPKYNSISKFSLKAPSEPSPFSPHLLFPILHLFFSSLTLYCYPPLPISYTSSGPSFLVLVGTRKHFFFFFLTTNLIYY